MSAAVCSVAGDSPRLDRDRRFGAGTAQIHRVRAPKRRSPCRCVPPPLTGSSACGDRSTSDLRAAHRCRCARSVAEVRCRTGGDGGGRVSARPARRARDAAVAGPRGAVAGDEVVRAVGPSAPGRASPAGGPAGRRGAVHAALRARRGPTKWRSPPPPAAEWIGCRRVPPWRCTSTSSVRWRGIRTGLEHPGRRVVRPLGGGAVEVYALARQRVMQALGHLPS
jgi:hypothetical protein